MSAYVWWYIVRFYGPISDGTNYSGRKGEVTKKSYVMSHYARFIRPGYYRVEAGTIPVTRSIKVTAYHDSIFSKAVIVVVNTDMNPQDLVLRLENNFVNTLTPYTTTEFKNVVQGNDIHAIKNKLMMTLEASSITTFVSK